MAEEHWVWVRLKKLAGACAAAAEYDDIKAAVSDAQGKVDQALMVGTFFQEDSRVFEKLNKANEGLGKVTESLEKAGNVCLDIQAVNKIHDAIVILDKPNIIQSDPQAAADAFDSLFQGIGRLCRFLPPPADEWGTFFESFNLFGNVQKNIYAPYFGRLEAAKRGEH
ncbi:MAG TPA: hypothetical protein VMM38_09345 [Aridibacter sp.]|nr:hypothetical protein [Aridibacter sp.]